MDDYIDLLYEQITKCLERRIAGVNLIENYRFIFDNIDKIYYLANLTKHYFDNGIEDREHNLGYLSPKKSALIAQEWFNKHNVDVNISELINNKNLIMVNKTTNGTGTGLSFYSKNKKIMLIYLRNNIIDAATIIHEVNHYLNQPDEKRNPTSNFLTEIISYASEMVFTDSLNKRKRETIFCFYKLTLNCFINKLFSEYQYIYNIKHNNLDNNEYYLQMLNDMKKYNSNVRTILEDTCTFIGYVLGMYSFIEYKHDKDFFNNIQELNNAINECSLEDCLKIIGLDNNSSSYDKIEKNLDEILTLKKSAWITRPIIRLK